MTKQEWIRQDSLGGLFQCFEDGQPTPVSSALDLGLAREPLLESAAELASWVPVGTLNALIGEIVEDRVPASPSEVDLPAGRVMAPWPWKAGTMIDGSTTRHPVTSYLLPTVLDSATLELEDDEVLHDSRLTSRVQAEKVDGQEGRTGLHSSLGGDYLKGQPRMIVTSRRVAVWGELREQVQLSSFKFVMLAPRLASVLDNVRMTQYAFGHSGVFLVNQLRSEWIRALVFRETVTERAKHILDRMVLGKGGTTRAVAVEVELPGESVLHVELYRAEGEQGPEADQFFGILRDATASWPGDRSVVESPIVTEQHFTNALARYYRYEVTGGIPMSLPDPLVGPATP